MTNKIPTTLEAARLSLEDMELRAREAKAWYQFVVAHPELNYEANREVFRDFHHGEEICLQSLEESLPFVKDRLAVKGQAKIEEEIVENDLEDRARLMAMTPDQLRKVISKEHQSTPLPESISAQDIKDAPPDQIRMWLKKYGSRMVNMRLNSRPQEAE